MFFSVIVKPRLPDCPHTHARVDNFYKYRAAWTATVTHATSNSRGGNFYTVITLTNHSRRPLPPYELQPRPLTLSTSIGTWAVGGKLAGTLTLMAGVWATVVCGYWEACCLCCSRRSCSWSCSRISCWRSRMRDVMAEELSGGLEEPCWSDGLLGGGGSGGFGGERCQMSEQRDGGDVKIAKDSEWLRREGRQRSGEEEEVKQKRQGRREIRGSGEQKKREKIKGRQMKWRVSVRMTEGAEIKRKIYND